MYARTCVCATFCFPVSSSQFGNGWHEKLRPKKVCRPENLFIWMEGWGCGWEMTSSTTGTLQIWKKKKHEMYVLGVANVLEAVMTHKFYLNVKSWKAAEKTNKNDGGGDGVYVRQSENVHDLLNIQTYKSSFVLSSTQIIVGCRISFYWLAKTSLFLFLSVQRTLFSSMICKNVLFSPFRADNDSVQRMPVCTHSMV